MQAARQTYPKYEDQVRRASKATAPATRTDSRIDYHKIIAVFLVIGIAAFIYACQQALVAQNNIDISRLNREIKEEMRAQRALKIERILLSSPSRLERLATKNLAMIKPAEINYIVIPVEKQVRQGGQAAVGQETKKPAYLAKASIWPRR